MDPFKAYDIRGIYPYEVNEDLAYDLGRALPSLFSCKTIVIGRDGRTSSDSLFDKLQSGLIEAGVTVINIGLVSTPQFYFALYSAPVDGGIMITASHNAKEYNGFKICKANAIPIFKENGLPRLKHLIEQKSFKRAASPGHYLERDIREDYFKFFSRFRKEIDELKILIDTGNGMGIKEVEVLRELYPDLSIDVLFPEIDGLFPNHECNPVKPEQYSLLMSKAKDYDVALAFDGDSDRVGFYTSKGLIPPDEMTGLLGMTLAKPHEKVAYEVRTTRAVKKVLQEHKIVPILCPSGHAYLKRTMKKEGAVFAGEKSGHYFYQILHNTDSALFTVMQVLHLLSSSGKSLSHLLKPLQLYHNSGELNFSVHNADAALTSLAKEFPKNKFKHITIDGLSVYGKDFFFNARKSNTEPLLRVNIEADTATKLKVLQAQIEGIISRY